MPQRDAYGNDLRLPLLERKSRKFSELFAEDASVLTLTNATVLKDYEQSRQVRNRLPRVRLGTQGRAET